jgi:hypothetical protein
LKKAACENKAAFFILKQRNDHRSKAYPNPLRLMEAHCADLLAEMLRCPTPETKSNTPKKSFDILLTR